MIEEATIDPVVTAPAPAPAAAAPAAPSPPAAAPAVDATPAAPAPAQKWSDTWREDMAGELPADASDDQKAEHAKLLGRLKRLSTPADAARVIREQDKFISSGQVKKALPKDAKPEQIAEWRKENGIPETPDKYELGLPKDFEPNSLDKIMLDGWAAKAHAANASPEVVKAGALAFIESKRAIEEHLAVANKAAEVETIETLRAEFGSDYRPNMDGVHSFLLAQGGDFVDALHGAVDKTGVSLLNNPAVLRKLAAFSRELGYVAGTVVSAGGDVGAGIDSELDALKAQMKDTEAWRKNEKGQKRFVELVEAKNRRESNSRF